MAGVKKYNIIDELFEEAYKRYGTGRHSTPDWDGIYAYMRMFNKSNYDINEKDLQFAIDRAQRKRIHYGNKMNVTDVHNIDGLPKRGQGFKYFDMDGHDRAKMFSGNIFFDEASFDEFGQSVFKFVDESGVPFTMRGGSMEDLEQHATATRQVRDIDEIKNYQQNLYDIEDHLDYMAREIGLEQQSAYFDYNIKPLYEQVQKYETKYYVDPNKYTKEIHDRYRRQIKKNKLYDKETKEAAKDIPDDVPNETANDIPNDIPDDIPNDTGEKVVEETVENMGDTVEETIENTAETVIENTAEEVIEETVEKVIKETTGINTELDGFNKKRTPKKLKKGTGKYRNKTGKEVYESARYWAVDYQGSNGDFAVNGPNGVFRLKNESVEQQKRRRKYEQTRQKYERKQEQRQEQRQKDFVDNTMHVDDEIDLDEINKQWYESKQKEFEQRQKELDDYFENNADMNPEDVLKDDYEPDANKFKDDIDTLDKNFEQSKDFDINKGVDEALDAADNAVDATRTGGSISKYLKEFGEMGFIEKAMTLGNVAGAVSEYKDARRQGHGVISSVARAGVDFALGEAMGLYYPIFLLAKEAPGLIVKGSEMLYKENRKMNSAANNQVFGDAQFQDTQQLATMRQSGMEMAKMAQYNLQQSLMGNEATYFHR